MVVCGSRARTRSSSGRSTGAPPTIRARSSGVRPGCASSIRSSASSAAGTANSTSGPGRPAAGRGTAPASPPGRGRVGGMTQCAPPMSAGMPTMSWSVEHALPRDEPDARREARESGAERRARVHDGLRVVGGAGGEDDQRARADWRVARDRRFRSRCARRARDRSADTGDRLRRSTWRERSRAARHARQPPPRVDVAGVGHHRAVVGQLDAAAPRDRTRQASGCRVQHRLRRHPLRRREPRPRPEQCIAGTRIREHDGAARRDDPEREHDRVDAGTHGEQHAVAGLHAESGCDAGRRGCGGRGT